MQAIKTNGHLNSILAAAAVLATAICAHVFAPHVLMASANAAVNLETMIPKEFGKWKYRPPLGIVTPNDPEYVDTVSKELAARIYSQEIGRSYEDNEGHTIMFLVAYGPVQNYRLKAHRPDVCYTAQGFRVLDKTNHELAIKNLSVNVSRLTAQRETRFEPVSYWMRVGNDISTGIFDNQILRLKYGLKGLVPDGALVRVSTVGLPAAQSFALQDEFIRDLLSAITPETQRFLVGATMS